MHVAVEIVLYRLLGDVELLGAAEGFVQRTPLCLRHLSVRAVVVEHLQPGVSQHALADQRALAAHRGIAHRRGLEATHISEPHLLPEREGLLERRHLGIRHRQRAIGEALGLLDLHEVDGFANRLERA